ncbi:MAG: recombinase family protein [Chloroflexota bacterium]
MQNTSQSPWLAIYVRDRTRGRRKAGIQGESLSDTPPARTSRTDCEPEHPGGVHLIPEEAEAVRQLFRKYARGTTTTIQLASWMNEQGYRTRNMHRFNGEDAQPRMFTSASVRGILHNPFYAGNIRHRDRIMPGAHEGLITQEVFEQVQAIMKRNSGRTKSLHSRPQRKYLLKGLIRCAYCGLPMWAQTYNSGASFITESIGGPEEKGPVSTREDPYKAT